MPTAFESELAQISAVAQALEFITTLSSLKHQLSVTLAWSGIDRRGRGRVKMINTGRPEILCITD